MADERIKLELDLGGSIKSAKELTGALGSLNTQAKSVADTYEVLATSSQGYELAESRIESAMDEAVRAAVEQTQAQRALNQILEESTGKTDTAAGGLNRFDTANKKVKGSLKDTGRGMIEASQAFQDFAQGGFSGVLNNIDGLVSKFGGSAGLAAGLSVTAVAAYLLAPAFTSLWKSIVDGSNDVPKSTDALGQLNDELKTNKDRIKELADQGKLTNAELAEYNGLIAARVDLEKAVTAEKDRQNTLDALRKKESEGSAESAEIAQAAIVEAGGADDVVNATRNRLMAESKEVREARNNVDVAHDVRAASGSIVGGPAWLHEMAAIKKAERERDEATKRVETQAEQLVVNASKGDVSAIRELARINPTASFNQATPEAIDAQNAEVQAEEDGAEATRNRRASQRKAAAEQAKTEAKKAAEQAKADAKAAADDARLTDTLNSAGQPGEDAMRKEMAGNAKAEAADAQARRQAAQLQEIGQRINEDTGGNLSDDQLTAAAKQTQKLMQQGVNPMIAAADAIEGVLRANDALMGRLSHLEQRFQGLGGQAQAQNTLLRLGQ